ncbi:MAG: hypothetical protein N2321_04960 [Melioribacteraceae bacterium]|nr:hypothetical protein [Melioribacteraceae bacterium]
MKLIDKKLINLYGEEKINLQKKRFNDLKKRYIHHFKDEPEFYFSSPGRAEIVGNHTDHNNGKVIAAAINLDTIAAVKKTDNNKVILFSENINELIQIDLTNLNFNQNETGKTSSLIRGIAKAFVDKKYLIGGFNAYIKSDVLIGSGLSSSASFEILIAKIFSFLFNNNKISVLELAKISKYAENEYFNKPCGLMDQLTCALGGTVYIDFKNSEKPNFIKLKYDLTKKNYRMLLVNTSGNHSDLTDDYSLIPYEMKSVADYFQKENLREIDDKLFNKINDLRKKVGDRAVLRAFHFVNENKRVDEILNSIIKKNYKNIISLINKSGDSSFKYLQNVFSSKKIETQNISLALALTDKFINDNKLIASSRVHGGGFEGTILVILPENYIKKYKRYIQKYFGNKSVVELEIRNHGAVSLSEL